MTDLTHALRAISDSLKDRAANVVTLHGEAVVGLILLEFSGAYADAADSLEHRWRERNAQLTGPGA